LVYNSGIYSDNDTKILVQNLPNTGNEIAFTIDFELVSIDLPLKMEKSQEIPWAL
jgi:hypothetical protein